MCRIVDLRSKEVINMKDGSRLGYICDVEIDVCSGKLTAIVVPGAPKFFGLFGREEDIVISWDEIEKIGEDIILVFVDLPERCTRKYKKWKRE
ncbi:YlmC/YmxH family sporulation protein [Feifania hominis]|uniref:YlmC/YmxH family sporulation protein n=1 Tax=Feifania hominis TaxID=2763660 RepID=A0A926DFM0_9FIRM|nr:YlmC/YmxH family sporulation protein [Feifania hominis]MBC8536966.1 YlmC/YmxH family sporulation protein [Feifania hominis]